MKHFNSANVWGRIHSMTRKTSDNDKPFVEVAINCESSAYGNVRAFGYLWGEDAVAAFMKAFRPKATVHLRGAFAQYKGRHEAIKTSFTFWKAAPWDPATGKHKAPRAAFILVGECMAYEEGGTTEGSLCALPKRTRTARRPGRTSSSWPSPPMRSLPSVGCRSRGAHTRSRALSLRKRTSSARW